MALLLHYGSRTIARQAAGRDRTEENLSLSPRTPKPRFGCACPPTRPPPMHEDRPAPATRQSSEPRSQSLAPLPLRRRISHLRRMDRSIRALSLTLLATSVAACEGQVSPDGDALDGAAAATPASVPQYVTATDPDATATAGFTYVGPVLEELPPLEPDAAVRSETERDWAIAVGTVEWAKTRGFDRLPIGDVVAMLGETFVGSPYTPGTLELAGPERLVVNLRAFDRVTLVEHLLVLSRITIAAPVRVIANRELFRERYRTELTRLRYRDGVPAGYESRLHYFSEWIRDAEAKGLVEDVTRDLGGSEDSRPIRYMSTHPEAYRQLREDPAQITAIRATEGRLGAFPRFVIPKDRIAAIENELRTGDIIAAVSNMDGLDVAHTGVAILQNGRIHLLNAPLVGDSVEISVQPLAERILGIPTQSGIIVARPLPPPTSN
ncbi:MAG: DUF1460 domain-containing protein [Gemmatimonadetes bacterium]|nr:DUF1460 domain-containing protein [Gemmatimonadota bacterium]